MKYKMRKLVFLFTLALLGISLNAADDIVFKAIAPDAVIMGEQFRLVYTVNAEAKDLRIQGDISDFEVLMGPTPATSHSTVIANGKYSSETSTNFTLILMPKKDGTFSIPSATVKVKNATYTSNPISIKVLPQDKASEATQSNSSGISDKDIFLRMDVSKRSVYEQEAILVTFKLYSVTTPQVPEAKFPEFEGFLVQDIEIPEIKLNMENYNGRNYQTFVIKQVLLYPQRSGKITIEGARVGAVVRVRSPHRVQSFFDDFFDSYTDVKKILTAPPVTIDVKPLPSGKPSSFSNSVGNFTMTSSINSTNVKANEAVTITVKINGTGNIKLVKNPDVKFPNDFDIYDPKVNNVDSKATVAGMTGTKTIEYMAIPRFGGDFEIPPITFSYFDPKSATYKTINTEPYHLHVEKGEGENVTGPVVSNFSNNRENVRFLGQDIRYLKVKGITFASSEDIFFGSFLHYMSYLIPALLFIIFFFIYRKQIKDNANIALVRTKKANKTAVRRLKNAGKLLKENKKEEFYDEVLRALWGYLSDKLNIAQSNLTKDNIEAELAKYGVNETLISKFIDILNTCEFARYAPSQGSDAMDKLYELTVDAIGKMENTIKK